MQTRLRHGADPLVVDVDAVRAAVGQDAHTLASVVVGPATVHGGARVATVAFEVDGRPRRAVVARRSDTVLVSLDGRVFAFAVGDEPATRGAGGAGSGRVTAPMPGTVVRVLVAAGDTVEAGQPLVILEAMKMETTLAAEIAGSVKAVHAAAGAIVDAGALLVEIA